MQILSGLKNIIPNKWPASKQMPFLKSVHGTQLHPLWTLITAIVPDFHF